MPGSLSADQGLGQRVYLAACIALGLVELAFGKALPELHPFPTDSPAAVWASGATLSIFAAAALVRRFERAGAIALAAHWLVAFALTLAAALDEPSGLLAWVPASKTALFALAALTLCRVTSGRSLRWALGATLVLYGVIHVVECRVVGQLVPAWLPQRPLWPYFTGTLLLAAGAALVTGKFIAQAALGTAALFGSWILLIHLGRIAANPASSFEWTFALSALALTGTALMVAELNPSRGSRD
jgi:uncharacterized membrane protein